MDYYIEKIMKQEDMYLSRDRTLRFTYILNSLGMGVSLHDLMNYWEWNDKRINRSFKDVRSNESDKIIAAGERVGGDPMGDPETRGDNQLNEGKEREV